MVQYRNQVIIAVQNQLLWLSPIKRKNKFKKDLLLTGGHLKIKLKRNKKKLFTHKNHKIEVGLTLHCLLNCLDNLKKHKILTQIVAQISKINPKWWKIQPLIMNLKLKIEKILQLYIINKLEKQQIKLLMSFIKIKSLKKNRSRQLQAELVWPYKNS